MRPIIMKSNKVGLSIFLKEDKNKLFDILNNLDSTYHMPYYGTYTEQDVEEFIRTQNKGRVRFAIIDMESNNIIGWIQLKKGISKESELLICICDKTYSNREYYVEAIKMMLEYGFRVMNLNNIYSKVFDYSKKIITTYEELKFRKVGELTKQIHRNGNWHNVIVFEMTKEYWVNNYAKSNNEWE